MMLPLWVPSRREVEGRTLKWAWRLARLIGSPTLTEWMRCRIVSRACHGPQTEREWLRFARALDRTEL